MRSGFCTVCVARVQRERAELEQNFAREISNLVQRLSTEKDQLEAELKLKHDQEVVLVRWVVASRCLTNIYYKLQRNRQRHRGSVYCVQTSTTATRTTHRRVQIDQHETHEHDINNYHK